MKKCCPHSFFHSLQIVFVLTYGNAVIILKPIGSGVCQFSATAKSLFPFFQATDSGANPLLHMADTFKLLYFNTIIDVFDCFKPFAISVAIKFSVADVMFFIRPTPNSACALWFHPASRSLIVKSTFMVHFPSFICIWIL